MFVGGPGEAGGYSMCSCHLTSLFYAPCHGTCHVHGLISPSPKTFRRIRGFRDGALALKAPSVLQINRITSYSFIHCNRYVVEDFDI